ncbi:MAG: nucleoside-triphosphatase [Chloroflexota bacterium]|nr:nucleoside-triphosphatase [Chloroflexota bacterium]
MPELFIITGARNVGKTRLCMRLIEMLQAQKRPVCGLVSPGIYENGCKTGILVREIASGDEKQLATYEPGWDPEVPSREWRFDMQAVEWGNERLQAIRKAEILLIDELGYLEMEQNRGWTAALSLLDGRKYEQAVLVIRPDLLDIARSRWHPSAFISVKSESEREEQALKLLAYLSASA